MMMYSTKVNSKFVSWFYLQRARRAAKKYGLDFVHKCKFRHQLNYPGLKQGSGEIVRVPMQSGKTGLYKATSKRYNLVFEDTGQRNWYFEFQGYAS